MRLLITAATLLTLLLLPSHSLEAQHWIGHIHLQQLQLSNSFDSHFKVSRIADGAVLFGSNNILQASTTACNFGIDSGFINPSPCADDWTWPNTHVTTATPVYMNPFAAVITASACNSVECISLQILFNETSNSSFSMQVSSKDQEQRHGHRVQRIKVVADLIGYEDIVFAGGEQFSLLNMARTRLQMISSEKGVGRGMQPLTDIMNSETPGKGGAWWTTYTHFPALLLRNGWAVIALDSDFTVFDFTKLHSVSIEVQSSDFSLTVLLGNSMMDAVTRMSSVTGFMQPLPLWAHTGAIIGMEGGQDNVSRSLDSVQAAVKSHNLSVAGVWIQDWSGMRVFPDRVGLWWNWQLDADHYPDFDIICTRARELGARLLTYFNPQLINISAYFDAPKHSPNVFEDAYDRGYLVMNNNGSLWTGYNGAGMLALHRPEVANWTASLIASQGLEAWFLTPEQLQSIGWPVHGFMADFGEGFPILSTSASDMRLHNNFSCAWLETVAMAFSLAAQQSGVSDDFVAFARSGCISAAKHSRLFWAGDQLISWDSRDGIGSALTALLTGGLFGRPVSHSDIGGYTNVFHPSNYSLVFSRSKELFFRWCELAAFTPVYRTHPGSYPDLNWQFNSDEETLKFFSQMQGFHSCWLDLRTQLLALATSSGAPVMRHMFFHYWQGLSLSDMPSQALELSQTQYLLGDSLLVVPGAFCNVDGTCWFRYLTYNYDSMLSESSTTVTTLLPPGLWVRSWSMQVTSRRFAHFISVISISEELQVYDGGPTGRVISSDFAPLGRPVLYALKGGLGEDVLHCIRDKAAV